jgi:cytoskeletal protein CcmA (bactofilin family)
MAETKRTLIEDGTELKGTLTSTCPIVVMGRVDGEMTGPSVEVTESGTLCGKAKVTELRSRGELAGEFDAQVVELSGRVRDKTLIRAQSLEVSLQRTEGRTEMIFGECELAVGDAPDKAAAVKKALGAPEVKAPAPAPALAATADGVVAQEADHAVSGKNGRPPKRTGDSEATAADV